MNSMEKKENRKFSESGYNITPITDKERERLAQNLTQKQRRILLEQGTETPFCGVFLDSKKEGTYSCRLCGLPLFHSSSKFNSGTGWPSFYETVDKEHIKYVRDTKFGMLRTEIRCSRCDGHQGHVFPDGPPPSGQRYCVNSESLEFFSEGEELFQKTG